MKVYIIEKAIQDIRTRMLIATTDVQQIIDEIEYERKVVATQNNNRTIVPIDYIITSFEDGKNRRVMSIYVTSLTINDKFDEGIRNFRKWSE